VHISQTTDELRGRKCGLSTALTDDLEPEEQREMEEDQDADEDVQEDVDMTDQQGDIEVSTSGSCEIDESLTMVPEFHRSVKCQTVGSQPLSAESTLVASVLTNSFADVS
jgi:hypothetical protein